MFECECLRAHLRELVFACGWCCQRVSCVCVYIEWGSVRSDRLTESLRASATCACLDISVDETGKSKLCRWLECVYCVYQS